MFFEQDAFGDFEIQTPRIETSGGQNLGHVAHHVLLPELTHRHVHRHPQLRPAVCVPARELGAGRVQDPFTNRHNQAGFFRDRDKLHRRHRAAVILPSQQRLDTEHVAVEAGHDRLVVQRKLITLDRAAQLFLQRQTRVNPGCHVVRIELIVVFALFLGAVHGNIGVLEQAADVVVVQRIDGDAEAGGDKQLASHYQKRLREQMQDFPRRARDVVDMRHVHEDQSKFVAAQTRHGVTLAHHRQQARGHQLEQQVAGIVAQAVVDVLEFIQIQKRHADQPLAPVRVRHGLPQTIMEQEAIR